MNYISPDTDLNELNANDTRLLTLLPDKLQRRLKGCLIDIDDLEIGTQVGKGTYGDISKWWYSQNTYLHSSPKVMAVFFFRIIFSTSATLKGTIFCSNKLDIQYFSFYK